MIGEEPENLRIVEMENSVFRQRRALRSIENRSVVGNAAQVIMGYFQSVPPEKIASLYDPKIGAEIIAAARILDSASSDILDQLKKGEGSIRSESYLAERKEAAFMNGILAAQANGFYGNFPSAETIVNRFKRELGSLSPIQICALACAAPAMIGSLVPFVETAEPAHTFLESVEAFLRLGSRRAESRVRAQLLLTRKLLDSAFDHSIWLSLRMCLEQVFHLAIAKTLPQVLGESSRPYVDQLLAVGLRTFLPPQFLALSDTEYLNRTSNAVICLPTSTGKTFLAELSIVAAVSGAGRIGIFVAPYVALGRQVAERATLHLPQNEWSVVRLFGGFQEPMGLNDRDKKLFVVATPERLDGLLRFSPELLGRIDCVVFDEAHMIESGERGVRLEGLISRLRLAQERGVALKLVAVSAVIPNAQVFREWMGANPENLVDHSWTPNCRRIAVWRSNGKLAWYHSNDPLSPVGSESTEEIASLNLPWPFPVVPRRFDYPERAILQKANQRNLAYLCDFMWRRENEPVLCVCAGRESTRLIAYLIAERMGDSGEVPQYTQRVIDLITERFPHLRHLRNALSRRVAYHNASLPHEVREAIENAARHKELYCVVSTTTLAEGVDLPFRVTILADWIRKKGELEIPYSPLLVRNIAGRCGRVGAFTEGDMVIYDNLVGDRLYTSPLLKPKWEDKVFFSKGDTGVQSSLDSEVKDEGVKAALESQFLAAISESAGRDDVELSYVAHLFASTASKQEFVLPFFNRVAKDITSQDWQLATRNSPLVPTPLGEAVNKTGFAPSSCRKILARLKELTGDEDDVSAATSLLCKLGNLPEQSDAKFRKLVIREEKIATISKQKGKKDRKPSPPKIMLRLEQMEETITAWLRGDSLIQIFALQQGVNSSTITPSFDQWREGLDQITGWDSEFDKFCLALNSALMEFLPWLLRACSQLEPFTDISSGAFDWTELAEKLQRDRTVIVR